jgi:hypothetical protein
LSPHGHHVKNTHQSIERQELPVLTEDVLGAELSSNRNSCSEDGENENWEVYNGKVTLWLTHFSIEIWSPTLRTCGHTSLIMKEQWLLTFITYFLVFFGTLNTATDATEAGFGGLTSDRSSWALNVATSTEYVLSLLILSAICTSCNLMLTGLARTSAGKAYSID